MIFTIENLNPIEEFIKKDCRKEIFEEFSLYSIDVLIAFAQIYTL